MTPDKNVGRSDDAQNVSPDYFPPRQKGRGKGDWHEKARKMRSEDGMRYSDIARAFNVTPCAVYFVINPSKRWVPHGKRNGAASAAD